MENKQLLINISKVINSQHVPKELKQIVDEIYREYHDAYQKCLSSISQLVQKDKDLEKRLSEISLFIKHDYEEDKDITTEIEETSYLIKREKMKEDVLEETTSNSEVDSVKIETSIKNNKENKECAKQIKQSLLSEIKSSKRVFLTKISDIDKKISLESDISIFDKEVQLIEDKIETELVAKIENVLTMQDDEIYRQILEIIAQYRNENKIIQDNNDRQHFALSIYAQTNPEEALKRSLEQKQEEKSEENIK